MYYIAYLNYLEDSLKLSEEQIFELVKQYSNKYFIAKSHYFVSRYIYRFE